MYGQAVRQTQRKEELTLLSTIALYAPLRDDVLPAFRELVGVPVRGVFRAGAELRRRIEKDPFDVLVCSWELLTGLGSSIVDVATRRPLVRSGIGLAVCADAPTPEVESLTGFVRVLRGAHSVAYSQSGPSGVYFAQLLDELGLAEEVNARATIVTDGFAAEALGDGRADVAIQQMSELLAVPAAKVVGPLPSPLQRFTEFGAAIHARPAQLKEARALLEFLSSPVARNAYASSLLSPV